MRVESSSAPVTRGIVEPRKCRRSPHLTRRAMIGFAIAQLVVTYALHVDSANLSGFDVAMSVRGRRDTTLLAMVAHPEYDDRYWRFVRDVRVEGSRSGASVTRTDSAVWRVVAPGGSFVVRYRLALPTQEGERRAAWKPFVAPTGALVGGTHSFMYIVGETLIDLRRRHAGGVIKPSGSGGDAFRLS